MTRILLVLALLATPAAKLAGQETHWSHRGLAGEAYGAALTPVGDWDRDGIPDWAAGAPYGEDDAGTTGGYVRVHSGRSGAELRLISGPAGQGAFGAALAAAGDVDRDGIPDLLVGAPRADGNVPSAGLAAVYSGADGRMLLEFRGGASYSLFGACVAGIGDVNGDGRPDILVGAPGDAGAGRDAGAVAVFSGLDGSLIHLLQGAGPLARFGSSACGLGDLDGDGFDDFAVGAPGAGAGEQGSVVVYSGASGSLLRIEHGARPGAAFGSSLAFAGDLDGDGFGDWVAGAPGAGSGSATAFSGRHGTLLHHLVGPAPGSGFGASVTAIGDLDGDGFDDFAVGAPRDGLGGPEAGSVTAYSGADASEFDRWPGDPGERAGSAAAPLDPTLQHVGFVSAGRGRKDLGVVHLRRWKPRRGLAPVAATQFANAAAGYTSGSTLVMTRFSFFYWGSGVGPWWGYYWSPYLWWPYSCHSYWWGPPRSWWWTFWDPCWSSGTQGGSRGGHGGGGSTPPPRGPIGTRPAPFPGGNGSAALAGKVQARPPASPVGSPTILAPTATVVRVPLQPARPVSPPRALSPPRSSPPRSASAARGSGGSGRSGASRARQGRPATNLRPSSRANRGAGGRGSRPAGRGRARHRS